MLAAPDKINRCLTTNSIMMLCRMGIIHCFLNLQANCEADLPGNKVKGLDPH